MTETTDRPPVSERGEFSLELGGETLTLRPTYEAIEAFEAVTGKGLLMLSREALRGEMSLGTTAQVTTECVRAWGRETKNASAAGATAKKVGRLILDGPGLHVALQTVSAVLALATTGGYDSSGNLKPAPVMTTPDDTDAG